MMYRAEAVKRDSCILGNGHQREESLRCKIDKWRGMYINNELPVGRGATKDGGKPRTNMIGLELAGMGIKLYFHSYRQQAYHVR